MTEPDFSKLADAIKKFDFKAAMRTAFGKCPEHNESLMHGNWLRWCEVRGCKFIAPITKTQRLEADANLKAQYERINRQWEAKDIANA